jgi:Domain of unknown function (DUF4136)
MKITSVVLPAVLLLAGCAGPRTITNDVTSVGEWPSGRAPGSYAFERLPSQQGREAESEALEISARQALGKAGFRPAAVGETPDVLVQAGVRDTRYYAAGPWGDPMGWGGGWGYGWGPYRYGPWGYARWGGFYPYQYDTTRYERHVGLLIRDQASGKPLYEARAVSDGYLPAEGPVLSAMFEAAMMDFPRPALNPRRVVVDVVPAGAAPVAPAASR